MVVRVFPKLILDIINKSLKIFKVLLEENFKIKLYNKSNILIMVFILSLFKADSIIEE